MRNKHLFSPISDPGDYIQNAAQCSLGNDFTILPPVWHHKMNVLLIFRCRQRVLLLHHQGSESVEMTSK